MVEIKKCAGTNVYILKDMLSYGQCNFFIEKFSDVIELQIIKEMPEVSNELWGFIGNKISKIEFLDARNNRSFSIVGLKKYVSITKAIFDGGRHVDKQFGGDTFKLFFYLNNISGGGGTDFYENPDSDEKVSVSNSAGSGVLFDIGVEHRGQPFTRKQTKYVIGVRPIIKYSS